ncbi:MAG: hypothetical protein LIO97_07370 [Tannerellaceae bacterium]|nr:hypothetical protein [Tannerellaceae bacterium]
MIRRSYNRTLSLEIDGVSPEVLELLVRYDWPDNVRDLENAIQNAMILCTGNLIRPEHLPGRIKGYDQQEIVTIPRNEHSGIREMNAQVEKELILETLKNMTSTVPVPPKH